MSSAPSQKEMPPNFVTRITIATPCGELVVTLSVPISPPQSSIRFDPRTGEQIMSPAIMFLHSNSTSSQLFRDWHFPPASTGDDAENVTGQKVTASPQPPLCATHRLIAFDLPGHGDSPNAPLPAPHYSVPSYAQAALAILNYLEITQVILLGGSLGGHVGVELIPLLNPPGVPKGQRRLLGLCISGTPPWPLGSPSVGFKGWSGGGSEVDAEGKGNGNGEGEGKDEMNTPIAGREGLGDEELLYFIRGIIGKERTEAGERPGWLLADIRRTHGRARKEMWEAACSTEHGLDQRAVVEDQEYKDVPIAVINGAEEEVVDLDYLDGIKWANLWCLEKEGEEGEEGEEGLVKSMADTATRAGEEEREKKEKEGKEERKRKCIRLPGLGHTPFVEDFHGYNKIFSAFVAECVHNALA